MLLKEVAGGIRPSGEFILNGPGGVGEGDHHFDGRFYQTVDQEHYMCRQAEVGRYLEGDVSQMPFEVYQKWVELDWKTPHGTYKSVERLEKKIREEGWREAPDALYESWGKGDGPERAEAISELGDVLWIVSALASNSGVNVNEALQIHLWGNGLLSHRENLTLGRIDQLILDGLIPTNTPYDPEDVDLPIFLFDEMEPQSDLRLRTLALCNCCVKQFGYNDTFVTFDAHQQAQGEIAKMAADHVLLIAWYARRWLNAAPGDVVTANVTKIRGRVERNLIDKSDGIRKSD